MKTQTTPQTTMGNEQTIWRGSPSQLINLWSWILCILFCWLVVPIFVGIIRWLRVRTMHYELTNQRLRFRRGILSRRLDEVELYRVRDTVLEEPLILRLFGLGNVTVKSTDLSIPRVVFQGIPQAGAVREQVRAAVETVRLQRRVGITELE